MERAHQGNRVLFWEDTWSKDTPLSFTFPRLYRISIHKKYIREMINIWHRISLTSHELWTRHLHQQEEVEAIEVYNILQGFVTSTREDVLV